MRGDPGIRTIPGKPVCVWAGRASEDQHTYSPSPSGQVAPGELVCIVGRVGQGKSSLIQAILGEMEKQDGTVKVGGASVCLFIWKREGEGFVPGPMALG